MQSGAVDSFGATARSNQTDSPQTKPPLYLQQAGLAIPYPGCLV